MAAAPENLKPLTTLRFAAALWVVGFHYWPALTAAPMPGVVAKGYLGVELFFVLSGFILSHVYLTSFGEGGFRYGRFLWARLARIYPVHLATLVGLGGLAAAAAYAGLRSGGQAIVWSSLPGHLTLTQAWGLAPHGGWNHPSWSISAEWFAYLAFPLFAWPAWKLRARPWLAVAATLAFLALVELGFSQLAGFPLTRATIAWGALRIVPCFAYGCAIHLLWRSIPLWNARLAAAGGAVALMAVAACAAVQGPDVVSIALFGALILALAGLSRSGSPLLASRLGVYLGEVSFSLYMVCIPWMLVFTRAAQKLAHIGDGPMPWWLWALMAAGVVPAAMAVHHLVERPARSGMRAWEGSGFRLTRESQLQARIRRYVRAPAAAQA